MLTTYDVPPTLAQAHLVLRSVPHVKVAQKVLAPSAQASKTIRAHHTIHTDLHMPIASSIDLASEHAKMPSDNA